jgi:dTDP-L-rhamnose 4-epimerase
LDDVEAVIHLAAAVGVGQSMYEIERYTSINALGVAVLLEEVVERRDRIHKLVVASSMSIYGEGQYRNPRADESGIAPGLRPESQLEARNGRSSATTACPSSLCRRPDRNPFGRPPSTPSANAITRRWSCS